MPELLLHFSIPYAFSGPVMGLRRALLVGIVAILSNLDVLLHIHRSVTHSTIFLLILIIPFVLASLRLGKGFGAVLAAAYLVHSPTPILLPPAHKLQLLRISEDECRDQV